MPDSGLTANTFSPRLKSLDVLRAVAILLMIFSGLVPKTLPNWMDHGYQPHYRPDAAGLWQAVPGIESNNATFARDWPSFTWVDLVFPMFLFAMGTAIPTALNRLRLRSRSALAIIGHILMRAVMLILFAVLMTHLSEGFVRSSDPNTARLVVIAGFLLAFLFFVRWPTGTPETAQRIIRATAFVGMITLVGAYAVRNHSAFTWSRSDVIILVLAQTYVVAAIAWLITQRHPGVRFVVLIPVMLLAHYLQFNTAGSATHQWMGAEPFVLVTPTLVSIENALNLPSWISPLAGVNNWNTYVAPLFDFSPLWDFSWYKYLWVVIPGTIVGDWMLAWVNRRSIRTTLFESEAGAPVVHPLTLPAVLLLCLALFVGLRHYGHPLMSIGGPFKTPWLALLLGLPALAFVASVVLPTAYGSLWIVRRLCYFGGSFVLAGLVLACLPELASGNGYFEGGISKGPPATLSYYFVSVGLCALLLMALAALLDYQHKYGWVSSLLEANGQNPLLAYYMAHTVLGAVMGLSLFNLLGYPYGPDVGSIDDYFLRHLLHNPWLVACWAAAKTLLIALVVWISSACRIYWRA